MMSSSMLSSSSTVDGLKADAVAFVELDGKKLAVGQSSSEVVLEKDFAVFGRVVEGDDGEAVLGLNVPLKVVSRELTRNAAGGEG